MATFVMVHGGHMGGWCWRRVRDQLTAKGHSVYAPSLTGAGSRAHLLTQQVTMETHVQDIASLIMSFDLRDVLLVGHSYGTWISTQVVDRMPERIAHFVCLDGQLFRDGESGMSTRTEEQRQQLWNLAKKHGEGWKMPVPPRKSPLFNDFTDEVWDWTQPRLAPMSMDWFETSVSARRFWEARIPGTMVRCKQAPFNRDGGKFPIGRAEELGWTVEWIDAGHFCMLTKPLETARILEAIAARVQARA